MQKSLQMSAMLFAGALIIGVVGTLSSVPAEAGGGNFFDCSRVANPAIRSTPTVASGYFLVRARRLVTKTSSTATSSSRTLQDSRL